MARDEVEQLLDGEREATELAPGQRLAVGRGLGEPAVLDADFDLAAVAELIKKYPSYPVQIIGYTDNKGKASELLALSAARAQAVHTALATRGVETGRLMTSGLGADEPRFDNKSVSGRAKNNRIEIVFLYPVAIWLDALGKFALAEFGFFIAILAIAYVYVWKKGALEWRR